MSGKTVTLTDQQIEELTNGLSIAIGKYRDSIALINREPDAVSMAPVINRFNRRISECDLILRKVMDTEERPPGVTLREMCDKEQGAVMVHVSGHRATGKTVVTQAIAKHLRDQDLIVHVESGGRPTHMLRRRESEQRDNARKAAHVIIEDHT
jgi:hypothetical protein